MYIQQQILHKDYSDLSMRIPRLRGEVEKVPLARPPLH